MSGDVGNSGSKFSITACLVSNHEEMLLLTCEKDIEAFLLAEKAKVPMIIASTNEIHNHNLGFFSLPKLGDTDSNILQSDLP